MYRSCERVACSIIKYCPNNLRQGILSFKLFIGTKWFLPRLKNIKIILLPQKMMETLDCRIMPVVIFNLISRLPNYPITIQTDYPITIQTDHPITRLPDHHSNRLPDYPITIQTDHPITIQTK
ncbi:MAG: hypothetical protein IPO85_18940 [Saprospiraceae bacterium]|uniref:Uncharacterized protein n=1 Tax=Candidatus Defluviibacterium haderslevense TaxID=2981993 RepID=A0A9D7SBE8_9BACT|nr:hypothetical protein [Candidatus Defluviibacterium haderslevense]